MSETARHLLIPFASVSSEAAAKYLQDLRLPNLRQLLDTLSLVSSDIGDEESFSAPHERALAAATGLPVTDGYIPWAAELAHSKAQVLGLENAQTLPWGFITLCHGVVGNGNMSMEDPAALQVSEIESRQLLAAMQPYFYEDGLTLHFVSSLEPSLWLCGGEPLRDVRTASLDRVLGKDLSEWQPQGLQSGKLRRLQNEMQMLLYIHTVNDARNHVKTNTINSIWLHGTGDLAMTGRKVSTNIDAGIHMPRSLADAALKEDWPAWVKAWEQLDATVCADLLKRVQAGEAVVLTLCGERSALRYEMRSTNAMERLKRSFKAVLGIKPAYLLPKTL
jgi:hypothetical protein